MKTQTLKIILLAAILPIFLQSNANSVKTDANSTVISSIENSDLEEELIIEDWMINDEVWKVEEHTSDISNDSTIENDLVIENWMTDDQLWKMQDASANTI